MYDGAGSSPDGSPGPGPGPGLGLGFLADGMPGRKIELSDRGIDKGDG